MRRVGMVFAVAFALLAFAAPVAADTVPGPGPGERPRETFEATGFDAFTSECGQMTCTDTFVYAEEVTTSEGTFEYVCVDRYTYNMRTGRTVSYESGCTDTTNLTVSNDLSSATLAPTQVELCARRACDTVTVSAELQATGGSSTFRSRYTERDGTCTYTYSDSGRSSHGTGTITLDGDTMSAEGSIREYTSTFSQRCR